MSERRSASPQTAVTLFIGKWTVQVLKLLGQRPHRHSEIRRSLGAVSQRMLTRTLRNLEASGLIARKVTRTKPVSVEYSLTRIGRTFMVPLRAMCRWSQRYARPLSGAIKISAVHDG